MYYWWFMDFNRTWYQDRAARPAATPRHDPELAVAVAEAMYADPAISGGRIHLSVQNGVAILDGEVDTARTRAAAGMVAASVRGIREVCNVLSVSDSD